MTHTDLLRQALDALELQEPAVGCPREREHWRRTAMPTIAALRAALAQPAPAVPVDMVLHCPACGLQHIDAPDPWVAKYGEELCKAKGFSLWTNPPHKSHLCRGCGHVWRPADVATAGVKAVSTKGKEDGPIKEPVARQTLPAPAVPDKATTDYVTTIEVLRAHIARLESAAPAVPADMVMVPLSFVQGFNTLAHNWSLRAEPPSFYTGTEGDAFTRAYAECGQALAKLRAMIASAPAVPAVDCRSCARCYATKGRGVYGCDSVVRCANGDRYQPLPPVKLWRAA